MKRCPFCGHDKPGSTCPSCGGPPPTPTTVGAPTAPGACWSCGGARHAGRVCPWCGAAGPTLAPTPEEQARRQVLLRRAVLVSAVALVIAGVLAAATLVSRDRRRDNAWKEDRVAAANATRAALDGLVLDPAASDMAGVQQAASSLSQANADLVDAEGYTEERRKLAQLVEEFRRALDTLIVVDDPLDESDVARARAAWGALADDADGIFEITGARIDVAVAQAKLNTYLDERIRRAQAQQRKAQVAAHRQQIDGILAEYEKQRAEFDSHRIGERTMVGFLFDDTLSAIYGAAHGSKALAESMRAAGAPTPALSSRAERMAAALDELAAAYGRVENLDGVCVPFAFFQGDCLDIGELPAIKRMIVETNAAHRRLANERRAWAAEVDRELAA